MAGIILEKAFPTFPQGFPQAVIDEFAAKANVPGVLANIPASGTEIIKQFGEEHIKTGKPIVYTSADSVFQIAAHEEIIPIERQYEICEIAREMLDGEHKRRSRHRASVRRRNGRNIHAHRKPPRLRRSAAERKSSAA